MTTLGRQSSDIALLHWGDLPEEDLTAAFRKKSSWIIGAPRSLPLWYATVLGNLLRRRIPMEPATVEAVRSVLQAGLQKSAFERLKQAAAVSTEELSRAIGVPMRTLARRDRFKQDESERLLRAASAFQKTLEVFGDLEKARRWFSTPKRALGGAAPLEFCDTGPGAEEVEHFLGRIEHGVFS